jgi:hypothetical protein
VIVRSLASCLTVFAFLLAMDGGAAEAATRGKLASFADVVDVACLRSGARVVRLEDPDGVGGQKPLGLGGAMQTWVADMSRVVAPPSIAKDWRRALTLLRRAGQRLDDAERLAAEGRARESGAAQNEAPWSLEPRAVKIIAKLRIPFRICFVE